MFIKLIYIFLAIFLLSTKSFSAPSDVFGMGTRNTALGGANLYTDAREYSAKSNPASLVLMDKAKFSLSVGFNNPDLTNTDLTPEASISSGISRDSYKAKDAENLKSYAIGLVIPLGDKLVFGLSGLLPINSFARIYSFTTNESNYLHYNDRQQRPEIFTGLGLKLPGNFSIGGGLFYSVKADGVMQAGISNTDAEARVLMDLKPVVIPYGGILYKKPFEKGNLLVGLSYRGEHGPKTKLNMEMRGGTSSFSVPITVSSEVVALYDPSVLGFGLAFENNSFESFFSLERSFWNNYKAPIVVLGGDDIGTLTGRVLDTSPVLLEDSWSFRLGHEFKNVGTFFLGSLDFQVGVEFHESSLPESPNSLAILDSDRVAYNLGFGLSYPKLGQYIKKGIEFNFAMKWIQIDEMTYSARNKNQISQSAKTGGSVLGIVVGVGIEI